MKTPPATSSHVRGAAQIQDSRAAKETHDLYDKIRAEREPFQRATIARAETFGELTCIDQFQVALRTDEHISVLVTLDGTTALLSTEVVERTTNVTTLPLPRNYFDQYHVQPKCVVENQTSQITENFLQ